MPQPSELQSLWEAVVKWRDTHEVGCSESIYQVDSIQVALPELAFAVLRVVGYQEEANPLEAPNPVSLVPQNPVSIQADPQELRISRLRNTLDYISRGPPHGDARDWADRALAEDDRLRGQR